MADQSLIHVELEGADLDIHEIVTDAIEGLDAVRESRPPIQVTVEEGIVTLDGVTPTRLMHMVILRAITPLPGVKKVVDRLREDTQIEMDVAAALAAEPTLRDVQPSIAVMSYKGNVALYGVALDQARRAQVVEIASRVTGVRNVADRLSMPG